MTVAIDGDLELEEVDEDAIIRLKEQGLGCSRANYASDRGVNQTVLALQRLFNRDKKRLRLAGGA
eukprot:6547285-Prymnesium_polylepis.1